MKNIKPKIFLVLAFLLLACPRPGEAQDSSATHAGLSPEQIAELEADLRVPALEAGREPGADSAICYRGGTGFVVSPPEGWVNLGERAAQMGLCVLYVPAGYDFDSAPAVIYPNLIAAPKGEKPVSAQAEKTFRQYLKHPEGKQTWIENPGLFFSSSGLEYQLRSFRNGPPPNRFEMVAYHVADGSLLILALSANDNKSLQAALPGYMKMLYESFAVEMTEDLLKSVADK